MNEKEIKDIFNYTNESSQRIEFLQQEIMSFLSQITAKQPDLNTKELLLGLMGAAHAILLFENFQSFSDDENNFEESNDRS